MKPKIKILIGLSVTTILITLFFLYKQSLVRHSGLPRINTTLSPTPFPAITTSLNIPNSFIWQLDDLKLPKEVEIFPAQPNLQGETILKNLSLVLGFKDEPQTIPNSPIIFYNNPQESTDIYLNTNENLIKFTLNLSEKSIPQETVKQEIIPILQQALNLPPSISIVKTATHYQTLNGPRFINTTKDKATLIVTNYNYSINSLLILFPKSNSIEITQSLSGKPIKITLNLPPVIPAQTGTRPIKTIEQIKNSDPNQFITLNLSGSQQFTLSDQEINLNTAIINNGFLGYIYNQSSTELIPYIFLTGTVEDQQYGSIEILLATPAIE